MKIKQMLKLGFAFGHEVIMVLEQVHSLHSTNILKCLLYIRHCVGIVFKIFWLLSNKTDSLGENMKNDRNDLILTSRDD